MTNRKNTVSYVYTPDGIKLSSKHASTDVSTNVRISTTDQYVDGLILRDGKPLMWQFDGGYVALNENGTPTSWNYYVTDHLGSTRKVVDSNNNVLETINYYPFGSEMKMKEPGFVIRPRAMKASSVGGWAASDSLMSASVGREIGIKDSLQYRPIDGEIGIEKPIQKENDFWQPYRFSGKELDKQNGLNMYDFGARLFDVAGVPMWTSIDPLAEKYYNVTPYSYCAGNPVMLVDPDGKKVYLYATTLPTDNKALKLGGIPTHTFITVENPEGKVIRYAAYGPEKGNPLMGFNQLKECHYQQDINVYKGIDTENLKEKIEVPVPEGMSSKTFDKAVINTINSFGNEKGIRYDILPTNDIQGNCNTSSSTILLKSGVSKETVNQIKEQIPGIKTGFDSEAKPWTSEEQKEAIKDYHEDMCKKSTL